MDKFRTIVSEISPFLGNPVLQFLDFKVQKKVVEKYLYKNRCCTVKP